MDCYCCCVSLREASPGRGGRATRLHSRTVSHLVTCPQDPRSLGKGRAAAAPGRGLGPCELHPRVELPGAPAPASPRELPGKAELLVKGSRPCASRPTAPPAPGLGRTGPAQDPIPQAPGDKKPLRAYLFPMTFGDTAGRGAGDGGGGISARGRTGGSLVSNLEVTSPSRARRAHRSAPTRTSSSYTV